VIIPRGIRYNRTISVVSSSSRNTKKMAVMMAINTNENKYCHRMENKEELLIYAKIIIPFWTVGYWLLGFL
jgi:hypothetical protein